jgi:hypothetical protein
MTRTTIARSALLAITTAFVLGCGGTTASPSPSPSATPTPTPTVVASAAPSASASAAATPAASQPTTGRIELPDKGFAVTLPDGWQSFPVDPVALQKMADALGTKTGIGQSLQRAIDTGQTAALSFWAFDMADAAPGSRNVTVLTQPAANIPLSLVESAVKGQIAAIGGVGEIESKTVTLPAGEALRLTYTLTVPNAAGDEIKTSQALYWIQTDKRTIVITGTGPDAATDAELQAIVESIEAI